MKTIVPTAFLLGMAVAAWNDGYVDYAEFLATAVAFLVY